MVWWGVVGYGVGLGVWLVWWGVGVLGWYVGLSRLGWVGFWGEDSREWDLGWEWQELLGDCSRFGRRGRGSQPEVPCVENLFIFLDEIYGPTVGCLCTHQRLGSLVAPGGSAGAQPYRFL